WNASREIGCVSTRVPRARGLQHRPPFGGNQSAPFGAPLANPNASSPWFVRRWHFGVALTKAPALSCAQRCAIAQRVSPSASCQPRARLTRMIQSVLGSIAASDVQSSRSSAALDDSDLPLIRERSIRREHFFET